VNPQDCPPLPEKVNLLVNVFTYAKSVGADVFNWCCGVGPEVQNHPRVGGVMVSYTRATRPTAIRNAACKPRPGRDGFHAMLHARRRHEAGPAATGTTRRRGRS
jgi:hypothetical protein